MSANTPVGFRTGFLSRCSRFGMGLGVLSVSRGYGPLNDEPIVPAEPDRAREGGPAARSVKVTRKKPKVLSIKRSKKTKCGAKKKKAA